MVNNGFTPAYVRKILKGKFKVVAEVTK
jgi:hypothetical protein